MAMKLLLDHLESDCWNSDKDAAEEVLNLKQDASLVFLGGHSTALPLGRLDYSG